MILNTGSRTDIPAYYSDWFYERVRAGEVLVRNPYYPTQITRYRLDPAVVDALVFCTKNPLPMYRIRTSSRRHFADCRRGWEENVSASVMIPSF